MDKNLEKILRVINKNNEDIVFSLIIKNYDKSNFFIALVFNKTIARFKVLYVPIDAMKKNDAVEEYFCYQFIFANLVNQMLKVISNFQEDNSKSNYDFTNGSDEYYIEFNTFNPLKKCSYKFRQYINPEFEFFFDMIVTIFEHVPNIMNDLSRDILAQFNSKYEIFKYNKTVPFRIKTDNLSLIFDSSKFKYEKINVQFLEKVGDCYYGVVNDKKLFVDCSHGELKIYSGKVDPLGEEVYQFIQKIKEGFEKKFYRLDYVDGEEKYYLLCYGYDFSSNKFLIHNNLYDHEISLKDATNKKIIIHDMDTKTINKIKGIIKEKYVENRAQDIIDFVFPEK